MINFSFSLTYFELYLILISLLSFCYYAYDKLQSLKTSKNVRRVPELNLLFSSLLGGTLGSLLAMILLRHKIKKLSFMLKLGLVVLIQISILYFTT